MNGGLDKNFKARSVFTLIYYPFFIYFGRIWNEETLKYKQLSKLFIKD
jgi:hypothetical protein